MKPRPISVSDAQIISGECGGNGRQIVRCRDISTEPMAAPDTGHGKPLLNGCGVSWSRLMSLGTNTPIIQWNPRIVRHSCNTGAELYGTDTLSAGNCSAIWLLDSGHSTGGR